MRRKAPRVLPEAAGRVEKVELDLAERCQSGRMGRSRKPLYRKVPWVRIPPSPPLPKKDPASGCCFPAIGAGFDILSFGI